MKFLKKAIIGVGIGAMFYAGFVMAQSSPNFWLLSGGYLKPIGSSWGLELPSTPCTGNTFYQSDASGKFICGTPSGGASSTNVFGTNGVSVSQSGVNATASLNTTYSATWTGLELFNGGLTAHSTTTLASNTILSALTSTYIGVNASSQIIAETAPLTSVGGNNTDIQYNNNGALGGSDDFTFDGTNWVVQSLSKVCFGVSCSSVDGYIWDNGGLRIVVPLADLNIQAGNTVNAGLNTTLLSTNREFKFPDKAGTFALTSDLPSFPLSYGSTTHTTFSTTTAANTFTFSVANGNATLTIPAAGSTLYAPSTTIPTNNNQLTNGAGYITGNQTITFTASGDATGTASGATSINDSLTVTGLRGKALPALATGTLYYTGGAWNLGVLPAAQGGTATTTALGSCAFLNSCGSGSGGGVGTSSPATGFAVFKDTSTLTGTSTVVQSLANNSASGGIDFSLATGTGITGVLHSLTLSQFTGNIVNTLNGSTGTYKTYVTLPLVMATGTASTTFSCPTCIATNTGNWVGTWQNFNASDFLASSTNLAPSTTIPTTYVKSITLTATTSDYSVSNVAAGVSTIFYLPSSTWMKPGNNLSELTNTSTARTNLGLGSAATHAATDFLQVANNLSDLNNTSTARINLGFKATSSIPVADTNGIQTSFGGSTTSGGGNCLTSVTISATGTLSNTNGACSGGGGGGGVATTTTFSAGFLPVTSSSLAITNSVIFQNTSTKDISVGTTTDNGLLSVANNNCAGGTATFSVGSSTNADYPLTVYMNCTGNSVNATSAIIMTLSSSSILDTYFGGQSLSYLGGYFAQTTSTVISNTAVSSTMMNATGASGTSTIPGGVLSAGSTIEVTAGGTLKTNSSAPTVDVWLGLGGTYVESNSTAATASIATRPFMMNCTITIQGTGSSAPWVGTCLLTAWATSISNANQWALNGGGTINTNNPVTIDAQFHFSAASTNNVLTVTNFNVRVKP